MILGSTVNIVSPYKAILNKVEGTVLKKDNSNGLWISAIKGDIFGDGSSLKTKENSYGELKFSDGSITEIKANTQVSIYKDYLSLTIGYIKLYITKLFPNFEVRTPTAIAGVRGTEFSVEVLPDQTTLVVVYEGEVDVTAEGKTLRIKKGESTIVKPHSQPSNPKEEKVKKEGDDSQHNIQQETQHNMEQGEMDNQHNSEKRNSR